MKSIKTTFVRGLSLLVFILAVNLVVPCFAASGVVLYDTKAIETGILKYDYDQIPEYMLEDNLALDALEYISRYLVRNRQTTSQKWLGIQSLAV